MSYLDPTHLIFSGDFLSDVSTVNNDPAHYNNGTFQSSFQEFGTGGSNGWWNPEGGATFNFLNCVVKQVAGAKAANGDPLIGQLVLGAEGRNSGKMVDLDPQEQGSSELWGVKIRFATKAGGLFFEGNIVPTGFRDLQTRQQKGGQVNGQPFGGTWTSVIENIVWGERARESPFLEELREKTSGNNLSLNLNAYGYYYNHAPDGRFSLGRILGAIGPWHPDEPKTFAPCRRLYGTYISNNPGSNGLPLIFFSNTNFRFAPDEKQLSIDFGSSFPISDSLGSISLTDKLFAAVSKKQVTDGPSQHPVPADPTDFVLIGPIPYQAGPHWLDNTGGIVTFRDIPIDALGLLPNNQLLLLRQSTGGTYTIIAREAIDGLLVRADNFVNRLDPDQTNPIDCYAYQWGNPLPGAAIEITLEPPTPSTSSPICEIPGNNYPADGISFDASIKTDAKGHAVLSLKGNRINNPRGYMDGQIYTLDYQLQGHPQDPGFGPLSNDNIFIHLRDYFEIPEQPQWSDIAPTMTQFSNLYPIMSKYLVRLDDPAALLAKKDIFLFAFSREIHDPIYMPVTRDLSENKRLTILKWLRQAILPAVEKKEGTAPPSAASVAAPLYVNPTAKGTPLTNRQQQLKNAVKAKNGGGLQPFELEQLYKD